MSSVTKRQPGCFLGFIVIRMTVNLHLGVSEYCFKNLPSRLPVFFKFFSDP